MIVFKKLNKNIITQMIVIKDNFISETYSDFCIPFWKKQGYNIKKFNAVTPHTIEHQDIKLSFAENVSNYKLSHGVNKKFTSGEIACFYSHFNLWRKCVLINKPILILEHDCILPEDKILKFPLNETPVFIDYCLHGSGCYYITPFLSSMLVGFALDMNKISTPVTAYIYYVLKNYVKPVLKLKEEFKSEKSEFAVTVQVDDEKLGTTIDHLDGVDADVKSILNLNKNDWKKVNII